MKFSIITPTYNRAHTIERAIKSILNQDYENFEMIIVDDGSSDNTADKVKPYLEDSRIKYIESCKNGGVNVARNIAIKNISKDSNWITFLDSDDEFFKDALSKMKDVIENNAQYNYFQFSVVFDNGKRASFSDYDNLVSNYKEILAQKKMQGEWVCTLSRKIIDNGFMFEESVNGFESLSWFKLSRVENCVHSLKYVRLYRLDTEGLTRQSTKTIKYNSNLKKGILLMLERFGNDLRKYNIRYYSRDLYALGNAYFILGEYKMGVKTTYKAIKLRPFDLRIFRNLLSLLPFRKDT